MKSKWITYNNKQILYCDYSGYLKDVNALQEENDAVDALICELPLDSVLSMSDLQGTTGTIEIVNLFKKSAARTKPYIHKQAVIGITGLKRVLAEAVAHFSGQTLVYFENFETAANWLTADKK